MALKKYKCRFEEDELSEGVKFDKKSFMFNGKPSNDIYPPSWKDGVLSIYINGGSPYEFSVSGYSDEDIENMREKYSGRNTKFGIELAKKVAALIEKEVLREFK